MAIYYIDNQNGNDAFDGLSPSAPKKDYTRINLTFGDTVLFKRGTFYREKLNVTEGVSYGAYGDGEKPTFCVSADVSDASCWIATDKENIWQCVEPIVGSVGNFVFNEDECTATFRWTRDELCNQGDFWDSRYGDNSAPQVVLMFSVGNPAQVYSHIEAMSFAMRHCGDIKSNTTFENLKFMNSGVHGLAGSGDNVIIRDCEFINIGGCAWSEELRIRYGNAIEFWEHGNNILVEGCFVKNVYDSCVTHQGPGEHTEPTHNFICRNNVFDTYGMAAFEYRDKVPVKSEFTNNICRNAGCGFAMRGEVLPRKSEIWPQPMGHHIFMWRMEHGSEGGSLLIANNYFGEAPVGAAVYSIISAEAEAQVTLENNRYTRNEILLNRWGGVDYNSLDEYKIACGQDCGSEYVET